METEIVLLINPRAAGSEGGEGVEGQERLLKRARQGDGAAFEALCEPYVGMVYRHCLHMLGRPADAEDAAQETLLRAFRAMPRFMGQSGVSTWLFRIAHNTCLDALKRPARKAESASMERLREEEGFEPPAREEGPEARYVRGAEEERLWRAVETLPEEQRALINLRYGDNLSYEELARMTGLREGTVKSKLSRAKARLKELLGP